MEEHSSRDVDIGPLLERWRDGDRAALAELTPLVYEELHKLARKYMRRERNDHTLQATALVNEAFMRLGSRVPVSFADGAHFYGVAAKLMRHILVDHAKAKFALRRGGRAIIKADYEAENELTDMGGLDLAEIDDAITKLEEENPSAAHALELHYFAGMTTEETARALGVSISSVGRELRFAKAWLLKQINANK